jgi:hypothetical protein
MVGHPAGSKGVRGAWGRVKALLKRWAIVSGGLEVRWILTQGAIWVPGKWIQIEGGVCLVWSF